MKRHDARQALRGRHIFLEALADGATVSDAAKISGIDETTLRKWRKVKPAFAADWDECFAMGAVALESECYRRAMKGSGKPVFYRGFQVRDYFGEPVFLHQYSDTLLMFLLKARDPIRFCGQARLAAIQRQWEKEDRQAETESFEVDPTVLEFIRKLHAEKAATAVHIAPTPVANGAEESSLN
jgi:hypothetical protein